MKPDRAKQLAGTPKFSPLKELATHLPTKDNRLFARNIANRLWLVMMGRGLIHPPDLIHSDNPASHPELLDALATDIVARQFDTKGFLRELVLTKTYQRWGLHPEGSDPVKPESYRVGLEKAAVGRAVVLEPRCKPPATGQSLRAAAKRPPADAKLDDPGEEPTLRDGVRQSAQGARDRLRTQRQVSVVRHER